MRQPNLYKLGVQDDGRHAQSNSAIPYITLWRAAIYQKFHDVFADVLDHRAENKQARRKAIAWFEGPRSQRERECNLAMLDVDYVERRYNDLKSGRAVFPKSQRRNEGKESRKYGR